MKQNLGKVLPNSASLFIFIIPIFGLVISFIWLLAVFKVFLLEPNHDLQVISTSHQRLIISPNSANIELNQIALPSKFLSRHTLFPKNDQSLSNFPIPLSSEWTFLRSSPSYQITSNHVDYVGTLNPPQIREKLPSELSWPPVLSDGTVPLEDGVDHMLLTNMAVPRFWETTKGDDLNHIGSKVNGFETIFLMIASYRDFQCRETISSAFRKADHPERLFVAAVDQVVPGDVGCLDLDVPCSQDPSQPLCVYRSQISLFKMDAQYATGPVTARHIGDRMYRGQYFVMQMDAHCLFVRHWDSKIIDQWRQTGNEMAVLSSYLTDIQGSLDSNGDSKRNTRPIMCNSDFEGMMPARYLRHGSQPESVPVIREMPQLQPFWAAGFSFSRGHFKVRVPYDCCQPMVFQGEEIAIGIRGFTHGYDFYAPRDSVVFHEYADHSSRRKKIHMFWENGQKHQGEGQRSLRRGTSVIGMAPDIDPASYDHTDLDKYGLGTVRPLSLFYSLFLIDPVSRKATQLCPFVETGKMHIAFHPHLREDGLGLDYSHPALASFDTRAALGLH